MKKSSVTIIELCVIIGLFAVLFLIILPALRYAATAHSGRKISCQNNLKHMGIVFKMYSGENRDWFPRMQGPQPWRLAGYSLKDLGNNCNADEDEKFTFNPPDLYPEYLTDWNVMVCPNGPKVDLRVINKGCKFADTATNADASYYYLGYGIDRANGNDPTTTPIDVGNGTPPQSTQLLEILLFLASKGALACPHNRLTPAQIDSAVNALKSDISISPGVGNDGGSIVYRLIEGVENRLYKDLQNPDEQTSAQSKIATMWDRSNVHNGPLNDSKTPAGGNVLYMDGHVTFVAYDPRGKFPVNFAFPNAMRWARGD